MKLNKTTSLVAVACAIVALCASDAAAQAPALTAAANGAVVTAQWTAVPGATGYDVEVTGALSGTVNVPATVTFFTVTPPPGTYNIRVRGTAGSIVGEFSNLATVTVGGASTSGPCAAPDAPTATVTTAGTAATVSWNPVAGAVGYRVEFSRTPGGTELAYTLGAAQTSLQGNSPFLGTFYVRVVTGNACGMASSPEVAFTIGSPVPGPSPGPTSGQRTADPIPGQPGVDCSSGGDCLLPVPGYFRGVLLSLAAQFPAEVAVGRPSECRGGNNNFLFRLLRTLRQQDTRWGLNYKRGHVGTMSEDIITYNGSARPDEGESHIYLLDIIGGSCFGGIATGSDVSRIGTWDQRGQPYCGTEWCARWTIAPYLAAGLPQFP